MIPSSAHIKELHQKHAPSDEAFDLIFTHCLIVAEIAEQLMAQRPNTTLNKQLVRAGALLHDIGAYSLFSDGDFNTDAYITHGIRGSELLQQEGLDDRLVRIASHHTGVGISKEEIEARHLPLPHEDFYAETPEERLVMYADKFHSKHPRFNTYESYRKITAKFNDKNAQTFDSLRQEFGEPDIDVLAKKYNHPVV